MPGLIAPALAAGLLVASTHVPLGREVLKRGIIFLDLAVAQIAGFGAIAAAALGFAGVWQQLGAFVCALGAALMFAQFEKRAAVIQEAFIGCAFVLAASLAIIVFANDPHAGEEISNLMAGQILWVQWGHIALAALIYAPILFVLMRLPQMGQRFFYPLFAACITISVQMIGVYLVFSSLILPALASAKMEGRQGLLAGYITASMAVAGGLIISVTMDWPSGPVIVCTYACAAVIVHYVSGVRLKYA